MNDGPSGPKRGRRKSSGWELEFRPRFASVQLWEQTPREETREKTAQLQLQLQLVLALQDGR